MLTEIKQACLHRFPGNKTDCSAFVRAVALDFGIVLTGDADDILEHISHGNGWERIDPHLAVKSADAGILVIGGIKSNEQSPPVDHGHVVVLSGGPDNGYPKAYWGMLGTPHRNPDNNIWIMPQEDKSVSLCFHHRDLHKVKYYRHLDTKLDKTFFDLSKFLHSYFLNR